MLHGELNSRSNLSGELTGGIFYGTMDYTELINKPSINSVVLVGNKTLEDLGINIPTELSELNNDVGFITSTDIPSDVSAFTNDAGYLTSSDVAEVAITGSYNDLTDMPTIPTTTSQLTNDSGFITMSAVPQYTSELVNDSGFVVNTDLSDVAYSGSYDDLTDKPTIPTVPTDLSDFNNDCGFIGFTELTGTLTAGQTSITLSDASITASSFIQVFADNGNVNYTSISSTTGSVTIGFLAQASDMTVTVRIS